jgi:prevent-host-death family protein
MADPVGVRELRQNLSKYLDRVKAGESLVVTEHGREVARLVPSAGSVPAALERLLARGATMPQGGALVELVPDTPIVPEGLSIPAILDEQRADRV